MKISIASLLLFCGFLFQVKAQETKSTVAEPWKQTNLNSRNASLAKKNKVVIPYLPLEVQENTISLLGRRVELDKNGFPKQIQTFFSPDLNKIETIPNNLLAENIHFHFVRKTDGKNIKFKDSGIEFTKKEVGIVNWIATSTSDSLQVEVAGSLAFDGFMTYTVKVTALQNIEIKDVTMHIPMNKTAATYMEGLGQKGGIRPEKVEWKWGMADKTDGTWLGNVNAGLRYSLVSENIERPLSIPRAWKNDDKGGATVGIKGSSMLVNNYTGEHQMNKGEELYYNFTLLITPLHL